MKIFGWIVVCLILGGGAWFFCRQTHTRKRNRGDQHGGGIDSARDNIYG